MKRMMKPLLFVSISLLLLVACTQTINEQIPKQVITTFEQCVRAGYPVMESYPRQCNTPEGKHFVEETTQPSITNFEECAQAGGRVYYSYPAKCETQNGKWFTGSRGCQNSNECGLGFTCQQGKCEIPEQEEKACKDLCGDGQCQEVVCMAIGCPCAERAESCPQDCATTDCPPTPIPMCMIGTHLIKELNANGCPVYACKPQKGCNLIAKVCPDGSAVGQVGPNCEYAPCPGESNQATCNNHICEEGEANDPGGCGPGADPRCLGGPARVGSCPEDCISSPPPGTPCCYIAPGMCPYTGEQPCQTGKYIDCSAPICNSRVR
ncbi:MAG: hypothetical protein AABX70_04070 [Nanoarchaeota archaeon]